MVDTPPYVSVTVPTRGRADHLRECVSSILACTGPAFEVIVVDQSDDRRAEENLTELRRDSRLQYIRTETRGVCAGRNIGVVHSRGEVLVCTDDDCRAAADWLEQICTAFHARPEAEVLCGSVFVPDELAATGYAVSYSAENGEITLENLQRGVFPLTANLAFRRRTADQVGPFDEVLGAGGPLRSGGESDFFLRVLHCGGRIFDLPEARVTHLGIRKGHAAHALMRKYLFGTGAAMAKHMRLGDPSASALLMIYLRYFSVQTVRNLVRTGRPRGVGNVLSLLAGALSSLRYRVDSQSRLYKSWLPLHW